MGYSPWGRKELKMTDHSTVKVSEVCATQGVHLSRFK